MNWWRRRIAPAATLVPLRLVACGGGGGGAGGGTPPVPPPAPAPTFTAEQLLPLATGHRWVYALQEAQGVDSDTLVVQVLGQETVPGGAAWRLSTRSQSERSLDDDECYRVEAEGIRSVPGPLSDPLTTQLGPALVLRTSFSHGDTCTALERDLGQTVDMDEDGRLDRERARAVINVLPITTHQAGSTQLSGVAQLRTVTTLTVSPGAGGGSVVWNQAATGFMFTPMFALGEGACSASFGAGATDLAGNALSWPWATWTATAARPRPAGRHTLDHPGMGRAAPGRRRRHRQFG